MTDHGFPLDAYLAGELDPEQHERVDEHLLACDPCWRDVQLAHLGRTALHGVHEPVPDRVRAGVVAALAKAGRSQPQDPADARTALMPAGSRRRAVSALVAVLCLAAGFGAGVLTVDARQAPSESVTADPGVPTLATPTPSSTPPAGSVLDAALAGFGRSELPGTGIPAEPAPDLLDLGLSLMAAGAGSLAGQPVTVFCYADPGTGQKVYVYLSPQPFDAFVLPSGESTGSRNIQGLTVFAAATDHPMLVLGTDPTLVIRVGDQLT